MTFLIVHWKWEDIIVHINPGADPGFCEGGFERGFVDSLKGTFEQK